jgi:hypothetical protein
MCLCVGLGPCVPCGGFYVLFDEAAEAELLLRSEEEERGSVAFM